MRLLERIAEWLDKPKFCEECGKPVEVELTGHHDPRTGAPLDSWKYHCPDIRFSPRPNGGWEVRGGTEHTFGLGRPGWFRAPDGDDGA